MMGYIALGIFMAAPAVLVLSIVVIFVIPSVEKEPKDG